MMKNLLRSFGLAALLCAAAGRAGAAESLPSDPAAGAGPPLWRLLAAGAASSGERLLDGESLRRFYEGRGYRAAWIVAGRLSPQIEDLLAALRGLDREGLRPADYHTAAIEGLLARLRPDAGAVAVAGGPAGGDADDLDLLLSDAFFVAAAHLTSGRVRPASVDPEWNITGRGRDLVPLLASALERGHLATTLRDLPPVREDYRLLRNALAAQRAVAAAGSWPPVPGGPALREGDREPRVAALRRRLAATGELPDGVDTAGELFDAPLADALRRFQARHGIEADAIAGRRTLAALNTPAAARATQIEANLERLRWLPRHFGPRHLLVNVADFSLALIERDKPTLAMRVIAGRQARRTPFFTGEITSIRLNPTWTVPLKIAVEDKLPLILESRDFLREHNFKVLEPSGQDWREIDPSEVDWTSLSKNNFPYLLRQDAGPENALGRVKFQIPNRHDIYLHDTPTRGLFAHAGRGFSSGCIRVERALELAERLLADTGAWPRERIESTIGGGKTVSIPLPEPLPVYLLYWTAWVDRDGALQFREDVYGRDVALVAALRKPLAGPRVPLGAASAARSGDPP